MKRTLKKIIGQLVYFSTFITVVIWTMLAVYGYRYDFETKSFEAHGVLFVDSPTVKKATVSIDGYERQVTFPYWNNLVGVGHHVIAVEKEGFYPFKKRQYVGGEQITRLSEVILLPKHMGEFVESFGTLVDSCHFDTEREKVLCLDEHKQLLYTYYQEKSAMTYDIHEFPVSLIHAGKFINDQELLLQAKEDRVWYLYNIEKESSTHMIVPEELSGASLDGVQFGQLFYRHKDDLWGYDLSKKESTLIMKNVTHLGRLENDLYAYTEDATYKIMEHTTPKKISTSQMPLNHIIHESNHPLFSYILEGQVTINKEHTPFVYTIDNLLAYTNDENELCFYDMERKEKVYSSRFSDPVVDLTAYKGQGHVFVRTTSALYLCSLEGQGPCLFVSPMDEGDMYEFFRGANTLMLKRQDGVYMLPMSFESTSKKKNTANPIRSI